MRVLTEAPGMRLLLPQPLKSILVQELRKRSYYAPIVSDETLIMTSNAKKTPDGLDSFGYGPRQNYLHLSFIHGNNLS